MKKQIQIVIAASVLFAATAIMAGGSGASTGPLVNSYPIVLSHGILGWDDAQTSPFIKYWGGMDEYLRSQGADVLTPGSTAMQSVPTRASQQKNLINQWMAAYGYTKVHILGHSQGGLVSRYMISNLAMSGKVRSLTTINTPHKGAPLADIALAVIPNWLKPYVGAVVNWFGGLLYTNNNQDIIAMAKSLTVSAATAFNNSTPNKSTVKYFSYGSYAYEDFIQHPIMSVVLPITFLGGPFYGLGTYNDGVVPYESQKWGTFKGKPSNYIYATGLDHLQVTNWEYTGQNYFDVQGFYLNMAKNALANQ